MALNSHHYGVVETHMQTLTAMGLPSAAAKVTAGNLIKAMEASPYAGINLASAPTHLTAEPTGASVPNLRQASARSI